mmetsp:Transcript_126457/g.319375  ORF Transcript_126457/g.319375 Transcript_126457/m.319375 type:complete len:340 (-) Transcript_126457:137-1156(-)
MRLMGLTPLGRRLFSPTKMSRVLFVLLRLGAVLALLYAAPGVAANNSACPLFLLFTTQRSGSTWTCQNLDAQPHIACGKKRQRKNEHMGNMTISEMMIHYSPSVWQKKSRIARQTIPWAMWVADANKAFEILREENCGPEGVPGQMAIGFKLMYDQVPDHLVPNFLRFVVHHNITMLHLVREAVILSLASHSQTSVAHSNNASFVAKLRYKKWAPRSKEKAAAMIKREESLNMDWRRLLLFNPWIKYRYVSYEQLAGPLKEFYLKELVHATGATVDGFVMAPETGLVRLHEPTCSERVEEYDKFSKLLEGTQSAAACAMLEGRPHTSAPQPPDPLSSCC